MKINSLNNNLFLNNKINFLNKNINNNIQKLSTGKTNNSAKDNPSNMLKISRFESEIRGKRVAQKNIQDGISLIQTAEATFNNVNDMGQKLRELSIQYNNETLINDDKFLIKEEANMLLKEIQNTLKNAQFNGQSIFNKESYFIQTGHSANDNFEIRIPNFHIENSQNKENDFDFIMDTENIFLKHNMGIHNDGILNIIISNNSNNNNNISSNNVSNSNNENNSSVDTYNNADNNVDNNIDNKILVENIYNLKYDVNIEKKDSYEKQLSGNIQIDKSTNNKNYNISGVLNDKEINGQYEILEDKNIAIYSINYEGKDYNGIINVDDKGFISKEQQDFIIKDMSKETIDCSLDLSLNSVFEKEIIYSPVTNSTNNDIISDIGDNNLKSGEISQEEVDNSVNINVIPENQKIIINEEDKTKVLKNGIQTEILSTEEFKTIINCSFDNILDTDFIDNNILEPIAKIRSSLGVQENALELKLTLQTNDEVIKNETLSKIEDIDMAKEIVELTKNQLLEQTNISLFHKELDRQRNNILYLLS